jgi:hypothetical protein
MVESGLETLIKQLQNNALVTFATAQPPPSIIVPYLTARLSRSEFTYVFLQVTAGKKLIRLYFYGSTQLYTKTLSGTKALFSNLEIYKKCIHAVNTITTL